MLSTSWTLGNCDQQVVSRHIQILVFANMEMKRAKAGYWVPMGLTIPSHLFWFVPPVWKNRKTLNTQECTFSLNILWNHISKERILTAFWRYVLFRLEMDTSPNWKLIAEKQLHLFLTFAYELKMVSTLDSKSMWNSIPMSSWLPHVRLLAVQ